MNESAWLFTTSIAGISDGYRPPPSGLPPLGNSPPPGDGSTVIAITYLQRNFALYGYILLFLFGFFGHINSIIIFLRHTLRSISTICLFICVAISDIIYLLVCIYDFLYTGLGLSSIDSNRNSNLSNALCRFRSFTMASLDPCN